MGTTFGAWLDLIAALGLIIALASAYARFRRLLHLPMLGQLGLGTCFGFVALLEMHHPIEPFDGMIVDLRNIPIALAGAFLGAPGALLTLAIGICARAGIGGVGLWAGIASMIIAWAAGRFWQKLFTETDHRGMRELIVLAMIMSLHLTAAFMLPAEMAFWFFTEAALPILVLNLLTVPLLARILEAERRNFEREQVLKASVAVDHDSGLMTLARMQRECMIRATALADGSYTRALVIRLRPTHMLSFWNAPVMRKRLLAAMHLRLQHMLPQCDLASAIGGKALVLPLSQTDLLNLDDLKMAVVRAATESPYAINGNGGHRISIDVDVIDLTTDLSLDSEAAERELQKRARRKGGVSRLISRLRQHDVARPPTNVDPRLEHLFAKADVLMAQNATRPFRSG
ncbi:LytS/YhcK type 5TM receptor domain-containing protein [Marivita sp. S0852]|uniref:LytS/YhcK type 5TM receptor domain-containing protein n=1 Tax=Marivita sp. S0852 TaxID=3373893 RepID=UPI003982AB27